MSKRNKKIIHRKQLPEPEPELVAAAPVFPWKSILFCMVMALMIFFLHFNVFDGLESFFEIRDRDQVLGAIATRSVKLGFLVVLAFVVLVQTNKLVKKKILGWIVNSVLWVLVFFYAGELWLCISPPSQGNTEAYISRIWFAKYWKLNQYGFRDRDFELSDIMHRHLIFYIGDSYVAGHGIKDTSERTTNLLEKSLQNKYYLINAGMNGTATHNETNMLKTFPLRPAIVVLAHVTNDIEEVIPKEDSYGEMYHNSSSMISDFLYTHSRNSVLLDMIYHFVKILQFTQVMKTPEGGASAHAHEYEWYKDTAVFGQHMRDVQSIANYVTDTLHARFLLVTYPDASKSVIDSSDIYVNQALEKNLRKNNLVRVYNTTPIFKEVSTFNRTVNILDGHPSKKINRMVADSLYHFISDWDKSLK